MSSKEGSDNNRSDNSNGSSPSGELVRTHYGGWVFHLGVNSIGHQFCHFRYMLIKGKFIEMYKRDPSKNPGHKPIRKGVASPLMMMEDMGLRKVNNQDLYVMRIYNRRDETKNGEFACATAAAVKGWIEAFEQAKQEAILDMGKQSGRQIFNNENDFKLSGHRPRVRRYAHGLRKLITIGGGPEMLIRKSSNAGKDSDKSSYFADSDWDATEQHRWKCIHTVNGIRILEDVANSKTSKFVLMKSVGVVDASPDVVFDMIISTDEGKRYEWDMLTSDLEVVERLDGHNDIVYGSFDPKYLSRWHSKRDFLFSRHWHRDQDGTYTILMRPAKLKPWPKKSSYQHTQLNPCAWEIRRGHGKQAKNTARSVVTQTMEIHSAGWGQWRNRYYAKFEKTIPFVLLCQVAGLREYFGANPSVYSETLTLKTQSDISGDLEDMQTNDEFYDAITAEILDEEEDSDEDESPCKEGSIKLRNVAWAIMSMTSHLSTDKDENGLLLSTPVTVIDPTHFEGSLHQSKNDSDSDCWSDPGGKGFMVRSPNYLKDYSKVSGGDPLLRLLAVDWFKSAGKVEKVATHPKCIIQSEAAKRLPFILVINLEVPSKPNYSMVFYFGADRPIRKGSLLDKFVNGSDVFRDERFKLIPSIKEGYWMVKRAVGSKACLLGKAVTCKYLRQDNFLEIDVDIGSSSVASSIIGLVLGYVTNLVVDLAILIEAKEESELPEYLLGTVRIDRIKLESAEKIFGN